MDGLESLFSPNMMGTANAILRAFNNRKYIFFVTLMLDQAKLKAVDEKKKEEQGENSCCSAIGIILLAGSPRSFPRERCCVKRKTTYPQILSFRWCDKCKQVLCDKRNVGPQLLYIKALE